MFPSLLGLALANRHSKIISTEKPKEMEKIVLRFPTCCNGDLASFSIGELRDSLGLLPMTWVKIVATKCRLVSNGGSYRLIVRRLGEP
jgi:hypothetical protein